MPFQTVHLFLIKLLVSVILPMKLFLVFFHYWLICSWAWYIRAKKNSCTYHYYCFTYVDKVYRQNEICMSGRCSTVFKTSFHYSMNLCYIFYHFVLSYNENSTCKAEVETPFRKLNIITKLMSWFYFGTEGSSRE